MSNVTQLKIATAVAALLVIFVWGNLAVAVASPQTSNKGPEPEENHWPFYCEACTEAWPCQGTGILCPNEGKQMGDIGFHEGPCFCLSHDGFSLVWVMEGQLDGISLRNKKTEWGQCSRHSRTPYCRIDSRDTTVCGSALIQWLRYLEGWFDEIEKKYKERHGID